MKKLEGTMLLVYLVMLVGTGLLSVLGVVSQRLVGGLTLMAVATTWLSVQIVIRKLGNK